MFSTVIVGNLGADAQVKTANGRQFVTFRVAHTDSYTAQDGSRHENTQWISCALSGDGGNLLQFLKKGQRVAIIGDARLGVASSQIARAMVATCDVHVRQIELIGSPASDQIPRQLADFNGALHNVYKAFYLDANEVKELCCEQDQVYLYDTRMRRYVLDKSGFVVPDETQPAADVNPQADNANGK